MKKHFECNTLLYACKYHHGHAPLTKHKQIQASGEHRKRLQGQAGKLNKNKWLIETKNTHAFFLSFPSSLAAASLHLFLPYALSLWWISPKQIRDAEESLSFLTPLSPLLIFPFSPPPSVSSAPLSFSLSLPDFLIYLPFLPLAYVDLILSHYDDLRFSFSCWPIKTKQQQQQQALPSLILQADS